MSPYIFLIFNMLFLNTFTFYTPYSWRKTRKQLYPYITFKILVVTVYEKYFRPMTLLQQRQQLHFMFLNFGGNLIKSAKQEET